MGAIGTNINFSGANGAIRFQREAKLGTRRAEVQGIVGRRMRWLGQPRTVKSPRNGEERIGGTSLKTMGIDTGGGAEGPSKIQVTDKTNVRVSTLFGSELGGGFRQRDFTYRFVGRQRRVEKNMPKLGKQLQKIFFEGSQM